MTVCKQAGHFSLADVRFDRRLDSIHERYVVGTADESGAEQAVN